MITHVIYHIPGRKVGCTRNLSKRMMNYPKDTQFEILEELCDFTDKQAGDREWEWADKFGYRRGSHFTVIPREDNLRGASMGGRIAAKLKKGGWWGLTIDQRIEAGKKGGRTTADRGKAGFQNYTPEQRTEHGRRGGTASALRNAKRGTNPFQDNRTPEEIRETARRGGLKGGRSLADQGRSGFKQRGICPHCGHENNVAVLGRLHFDKCKSRKIT